jgi:uncharacterized protein (TIGR00369 family)
MELAVMQVRNPDYRRAIVEGFGRAAFVQDIGIEFADCGPGWCLARLAIEARHRQHGGLIHAGVQATLADHTAGAAATTLLDLDQFLVTAEFKLVLIRPAVSESLECRAEVIRAGRALCFVEARVFGRREEEPLLVSVFSATLSVDRF